MKLEKFGMRMKAAAFVVVVSSFCAEVSATAVSAKAYVQSGLVAHYDGIENAGYGSHDDSSATWKDLAGGVGDGTLNANVSWLDNGWTNNASGQPVTIGPNYSRVVFTKNFTVEYAVRAARGTTRETFIGNYSSSQNFNLEHYSDGKFRDYYNAAPDFQNGKLVANQYVTKAAVAATGEKPLSYTNGVYAATASAKITAALTPGCNTIIGGELNRANMAFYGTFHALRLYDRPLTAAEIAWNAMIDRARFLGEPLDESVETPLYRVRNGAVEIKCAVAVGTTGGGSVSVASGGQSAGAGESFWAAFGGSQVTYTATAGDGKSFLGWTGDVEGLTLAERHNPALTLDAVTPRALVANFGVLEALDYLESTGTQHIDCGVHFTYGHRFTLRWSQASHSYKYAEDKGWGTGGLSSGNQLCICGGGRAYSNNVQPYYFNAQRAFTPTLAKASLVLGDPYEDVCTVSNKIGYTMTHLADGTVYTGPVADTPNTTGYDSGNNINLFSDNSISYRYNGMKRIYRATYETIDGKVVFDLFPAKLDGVPGFYDRVTCQFHPNAGTGDFVCGHAASWFRFRNGDVEVPMSLPRACGGGTVRATFDGQTYTTNNIADVWVAISKYELPLVCEALPDDDASFVRWECGGVATASGTTLTATLGDALNCTAQFMTDAVRTEMNRYVQTGLFAQWDGKYNAGYVHDPQATEWKELKGDLKTEVVGTLSFTGDAAVFDNTYLKGSSPLALQSISNKAFTIEMDVTPTSYERYAAFFGFGDVAKRALVMHADTLEGSIYRNAECLDYRQTAWDKTKSWAKAHAASGLRTTIAVVCDGNSARLYLDGVLTATSTAGAMTDAQILASSAFFLGTWGHNSYLNYRQDMRCHGIRFYSRALSAADVAANAAVDADRHAPFLVGDTYVMPVGKTALDVGYVPNARSRIVIDSQMYATTNSCRLFGVEYGNVFMYEALNPVRAFSWRDYATYGINSYNPDPQTRAVFVYDNPRHKVRAYVGGKCTTVAMDGLGSKLDASGTLYLFATHKTATTAESYSSFKFYSLSIYEGETLVKCLVPHDDGTRVGLRDLVSGEVTYPFAGDLALGRDDDLAAKTMVTSTDIYAAPGAFPSLGTARVASGVRTFTAGDLEDLGGGQRGIVDADGVRHVYRGWEMNCDGTVTSGDSESFDLTLTNAMPVAIAWKWDNLIPVTVTCDAADGTVTLNGESGTSFTAYVMRGAAVPLVFTPAEGKAFGYWTGLPRNAGFTNAVTTLTADAPFTLRAYRQKGMNAWSLDDYITDGASTWFDAKNNQGRGKFSATTTTWANLVPGGDDGKLTATWAGCWHDGILDFDDRVCLIWQATTVDEMTVQLSGSSEPLDYEHKTMRQSFRFFMNGTAPQFGLGLSSSSMYYCPNNVWNTSVAAVTNVGFDCIHSIERKIHGIAYAGGGWKTNKFTATTMALAKRPITSGATTAGSTSITGYMRALRVYDRLLTDGERAVNALVDRRRYAIAPFSGLVVSSLPREFGTMTPAMGVYENADYTSGKTEFSVTGLSAGADGSFLWIAENEVRALFKGWRAVMDGVATTGKTQTVSLTLPEWGESYLVWDWEIQSYVTITGGENAPKFRVNGGAAVSSWSGWLKKGSEVVLTPVEVTEGYTVGQWTGAPSGAKLSGDGTLTFTAGESALTLSPVASVNAPKHWTGAAGTGLASDAGNWADDKGAATGAPANGDSVVLDAGSANNNLTWDLDNVTLASWTQTADYAGKVTFLTGRASRSETHGVLSSDGKTREFAVTGDVSLAGGTWVSMPQPSLASSTMPEWYDGEGVYRLVARVGGNFNLAKEACINVSSNGYVGTQGPGPGSHGGQGTGYWGGAGNLPYGSVKRPTTLGSGKWSGVYGGGNVVLSVAGTAAVNGSIQANAGDCRGSNTSDSGAGGSIWLTAKRLVGSGLLRAHGGRCWSNGWLLSGGGSAGRIAVHLTGEGETFENWTGDFDARLWGETLGKGSWGRFNPGTLYLETTDQNGVGDLWVVGSGKLAGDGNWWASPSGRGSQTMLNTDDEEDTHFRDVIISNGCQLAVYTGTKLTVDREVISDARSQYKEFNVLILRGGEIELTNQRQFTNLMFRVYASNSVLRVGSEGTGTFTVNGGTYNRWDNLLHIYGSLRVLKGGAIQHYSNVNSDAAKVYDYGYRLRVHVTGDVTVDAGGSIHANGVAMRARTSPLGYLTDANANDAGSYGGLGAETSGELKTYGDPLEPQMLGASGGNAVAGGLVRLEVDGTLTNDGTISANGNNSSSAAGAASGGSVWLTADALAGSGVISANGGYSSYATKPVTVQNRRNGGGGRVAVYLSGDGDFADYTGSFQAKGGFYRNNNDISTNGVFRQGGAGTVFLCTAAEKANGGGQLVLDNGVATGRLDLPAATLWTPEVANRVIPNVFVTNSVWLCVEQGEELEISGSLTNRSQCVADLGEAGSATAHGGRISFVDASRESTIAGRNDFMELYCAVPGKTLRVDANDGSVQYVSPGGKLTLAGTEANSVRLRSTVEGAKAKLAVLSGGSYDVTYTDVKDADASEGVVISVDDTNYNSGNLLKWVINRIIPGEENRWTGSKSSDWGDAENWSLTRVPAETDAVVINTENEGHQPVLSANVRLNSLLVRVGNTLDLGMYRVTVTNGVTIAGAVSAASATLVLEGDQIAQLNGAQFGAVEVAGDVRFDTGFTAGSFSAAAPASETIRFAAGASFVFDDFEIAGTVDGEPSLTLASTMSGTAWRLKVNSRAVVAGAIVSDSDASAGIRIADQLPGRAEGTNNRNWLFGVVVNSWVGTYGTDWSVAANWSLNQVPDAETLIDFDRAVTIAVPAGYTARAVGVTVSGGTVVINGPAGQLEVEGSFEVLNGGTIELNVPTHVKGAAYVRTGGKLSHSTSGEAPASDNGNALNLTVDGDFTIENGGAINVENRGYTYNTSGVLAPHGSRPYTGQWTDSSKTTLSAPALGSIFTPTNVAVRSGGYIGGGRVHVVTRGTLTVNGEINASGTSGSSGSAGGSVWLDTPRLRGTGAISATGSDANYAGGNGGCAGRVAIYLREDTSLDAFAGTVSVRGSRAGYNPKIGGGYYLETAADKPRGGRLIVDNEGMCSSSSLYAGVFDLPVTNRNNDAVADYKDLTVDVKGSARLYLTQDLTIKDLTLGGGAEIRLDGHTLTVRSRDHHHFRNCSTNGCSIVTGEGGRIIWLPRPLTIIVR